MTQIIGKYREARGLLHKVESTRNVKVLWAVESGSRCWGFASINSDYDVRFIYTRPIASYLGPASRRDVIEPDDFPNRDALIDPSGWDIVKTLELASRSNPALLEWLMSPIVYYEYQPFVSELRSIMQEFDVRAVMHHYASMAYTQHRQYLAGTGETVVYKKYLYALRPIFAALALRAHPDVMPPIAFDVLMSSITFHEDVRAIVEDVHDLLERKAASNESDKFARYPRLDSFIFNKISQIREMAKEAPQGRGPDLLRLEDLSVSTIKHFNR